MPKPRCAPRTRYPFFFANHSEAMRTPRPMVARLEWNNIGLAAFVAPNAQLLPVASCLRCRRRVVVTPPHTRQIIQEPWHPPDHRDSHHPTAKGYPRTAWAIKNVYAAAPVCTSGTAIYLKMLPSLVARCGARGCSSAKRHTNPRRPGARTAGRTGLGPGMLRTGLDSAAAVKSQMKNSFNMLECV